ncbi:MAG: twin-arginine translocase TatA/TatE family subunit [Elusimicrobiota bacterium]|jgi:TatA/E family protein of Tat protein translocase|nr:twin-arginine translocase TatA/TatE family subunit [Elusimicrobiota bacterium]
MFGLGFQELIVILLLALLFFGAKRLPGIAKSLGKSINEFKKGMGDKSDYDDKPKEIENSDIPLKKDKED